MMSDIVESLRVRLYSAGGALSRDEGGKCWSTEKRKR